MRKEASMPCLTLEPISPPRGACPASFRLDLDTDGMFPEVRQPPRSAPHLSLERTNSAGSNGFGLSSPADQVKSRRRRAAATPNELQRPQLVAVGSFGHGSRLLAGLRSPPLPAANSLGCRPAPPVLDFIGVDEIALAPTPPRTVSTPGSAGQSAPPRGRRRPTGLDFGACGLSLDDESDKDQDVCCGDDDADGEDTVCLEARPRTHAGAVRRPGSLSIAAFSTPPSSPAGFAYEPPDTPGLPDRQDFRAVGAGVAVVFFDFDGTLTASPGDRAVRRMKQAELLERAPMLAPRLQALREAGLTLGIISKSTEGTIRSSLDVAGLADFFDGPLVARAVGFEGKVGFIEELAKKGGLRRLGGRGEKAGRRVLLVDDDVLECQRAQARGLQTYAAPEDGGLQENDFDVIFQGLRIKSRSRSRATSSNSLGSAPPAIAGCGRPHSSASSAGLLPPLDSGRSPSQSPPKPASKRRNKIMFMGGCFDG